MKNIAIYLAILVGVMLPFLTVADNYTDASLALCEKVKSCAIAQMGEQDVTPEMQKMIQPMLDNMCANMSASMPEVAKEHALYKPAMACMNSLEALSCEQMQEGTGSETPACKEYEALAEKYSGS